MKKAAVLGGGSFGTVIANILADNGIATTLYLRDPKLCEAINRTHSNPRYLPYHILNEQICATTDIEEAVKGSDALFICVPSSSLRTLATELSPFIMPHHYLISTIKGIEQQSFLLMSEVLTQIFPHNAVGVISGPNLAKEIACKHYSASVIASDDPMLSKRVQQSLSTHYFRLYTSKDRYGVELGGALKNIYALISGCVAAMGMGENSKAMLITRALAEMNRFAVALGANPLTFLGLAGVGDVVVTCISPLSRNYRLGYALGQGKSLKEAIDEIGEVVEGVATVGTVYHKAQSMNIRMPLARAAYAVLFEGKQPQSLAPILMQGDLTSDVDFSLLGGLFDKKDY